MTIEELNALPVRTALEGPHRLMIRKLSQVLYRATDGLDYEPFEVAQIEPLTVVWTPEANS